MSERWSPQNEAVGGLEGDCIAPQASSGSLARGTWPIGSTRYRLSPGVNFVVAAF
jgi:hypothetical protein